MQGKGDFQHTRTASSMATRTSQTCTWPTGATCRIHPGLRQPTATSSRFEQTCRPALVVLASITSTPGRSQLIYVGERRKKSTSSILLGQSSRPFGHYGRTRRNHGWWGACSRLARTRKPCSPRKNRLAPGQVVRSKGRLKTHHREASRRPQGNASGALRRLIV